MTFTNPHRRRTARSTAAFLACISLYLLISIFAHAGEKGRPARFLPKEKEIVIEFFRRPPASGLPPGLAKRGGDLPPGLQKQLKRKGTLPPGLQKRLEPLPSELEIRLPKLPEAWGRVILGRHVILIDRRTQRILDIIENVVGLATGN